MSKKIEALLVNTNEKFSDYQEGYLRVLVLEPYIGSDFLFDKDIEEAIVTTALPLDIDQIWLAEPRWISASRYDLRYRLIRERR